MKAENCKLSGTDEEEFSLSSWTNESSIEKKSAKSSHKTNRAPAPKKKQANKPPREQSREVSEKHEKKNAKKRKKKFIFLKFISKQKNFLFYLFRNRRWGWFSLS